MTSIANADRLPVPLALCVMSVAAAVAVAMPDGWPIRAVLVALFLLVAPGLLLLPLVPADRGRWVFVVPMSIAVDVLVSEVVVISRGDLAATVLLMAAVIFTIGVARVVWLVSRPPANVHVTLVGPSDRPVKVTMSRAAPGRGVDR